MHYSDNYKVVVSETPIPPPVFVESFSTGPGGKIHLLYGVSSVFRLAMFLTTMAVIDDEQRIAMVDGCNGFDIQAITGFARERGIDPDRLLERILISRGFTCYQMEATIVGGLPRLLKRINGRTAVILGLLDTLYDEEAPFREVQQILQRTKEALAGLRAGGISVLLTQKEWNVRPSERNGLLSGLKEEMDKIYHVPEPADGVPRMYLEQPPSAVGEGKKGTLPHGTNNTHVYKHHR